MVEDLYIPNTFYELPIDIQDKILIEYKPNLPTELMEQIQKVIMMNRFENYLRISINKHKPKPIRKKTAKQTTKKTSPIEDDDVDDK